MIRKKKLELLIIAIVVGIISGISKLISYSINPDFTMMAGSLDVIGYGAKFHYFALTNQISSPYSFSDLFNSVLFGTINKFVPIEEIFVFNPFIFVPLLFISMYYFLREIGYNHETCIFSVSIGILASFLFYLVPTIRPDLFFDTIFGRIGGAQIRFPNQMVSGSLFFITFTILYKVIVKNEYSKILVFLAGILVGTMIFVYSYYYVLLMFILCIYFFLSIYSKDMKRCKVLGTILFIGGLFFIPTYIIYSSMPIWMKEILGINYYFTELFNPIKEFVAGILIYKFVNRFIGVGIISAEILNIVTRGYIVQPFHFRWLALPLIGLGIGIYISNKLKEPVKWTYIFLIVALLIQVNNGFNSDDSISNNTNTTMNLYSQRLLTSTTVLEVYPTFFLKNTPVEVMSYLNLTDNDLQVIDSLEYGFTYHGWRIYDNDIRYPLSLSETRMPKNGSVPKYDT